MNSEELEYWREHLRGAPLRMELPVERSLRPRRDHATATIEVTLDADVVARLDTFSMRTSVQPSTTLLAAWSIVLSRVSGQKDFVVGVGRANGHSIQRGSSIDSSARVLPLRLTLEDDPTVVDLLARFEASLSGARREGGDAVPDEIRRELQLQRLPEECHFVAQTQFVFCHKCCASKRPCSAAFGNGVPVGVSTDVCLLLERSDDVIRGVLAYAIDLFETATMQRWSAFLMTALQSMMQLPDAPVSRVSLMSAAERSRVLDLSRGPVVAPLQEGMIHEFFEEQVRRTPQALAVAFERESLSFLELNARANRVARYLRAQGVGPDRLVALCVERSVELIVGLLGILKAGGAYLPLDPEYPPERLRYMLTDSRPRVILTQAHLRDTLEPTDLPLVSLDADWNAIAALPGDDIECETTDLSLASLAYVIYTSGSTGLPKGVMIEHRHVVNLWRALDAPYRQVADCQRVALNASCNFDASVQQWVQLLSGRALFVIPKECRRDPSRLVEFLQQHRIDSVDCTPSQLKSWLSAGLVGGAHDVRLVLVGGEAIDSDLWTRLASATTPDFYNVYGPTECTVDSVMAHVNGERSSPHIGRPMGNRRIHILDEHGELLPSGVVGEIYIGGAGVGRGYLNRSELTSARFVTDPLNSEPGSRMYKTGDLARWRSDGTLEYLGRNDEQVKIRGYRIELGEIEAQLASHAQVKQAAVVVREDIAGDKYLAAYVVPSAAVFAPSLLPHALRERLKSALPDYMVPRAIMMLDRLPLTPSGKLDRHGLPTPDLSAYAMRPYEPPRNAVEAALADIWRDLLSLPTIGRQDDFFEVGGDSLTVMRLIHRVRDRMAVQLQFHEVLRHTTIAEMAACVDGPREQQCGQVVGEGDLEEGSV